jgi:putative addiction module component (TIGR02574 family)
MKPAENCILAERNMSSREQVLHDALELSPEDRGFVADQLEQSLRGGEFASPEIAAAWKEEIERRIAAFERGETKGIDADESIERLRRFLSEHRVRVGAKFGAAC